MHIYKHIVLISALFAFSLYAKADNSKLSPQEQRKFDYFFYEAINARASFEHDQAFDLLMHCHTIDPNNAHVLYELGNYHTSLDEKNLAKDFYQKSTKYDSENFYYNMAYANLCLEDKEYETARNVYLKLIDKDPEKSELYLYLSESYRLDSDLEGAISALDKLETSIGLNEKVSMQKFQLYTMLGMQEKGFAEIQKYIDKKPNELQYRILLGRLYLQADMPTEAERVYREASKIEADNPFLISAMAEYYEHINDEVSAEKELKKALLSPNMDIETKLSILGRHIGTLQQNKKDVKSANPLVEELIELHPQEPDLNIMYGNLLLLQEDSDGAFNQFHIYAQALPNSPLGWEQMLSAAFPDSVNKIIFTCQEAIKSLPEEPQFYFYLGVAYHIEKENEKALESLETGLKFADEDNPVLLSSFYGQLGDVHHQMGNTDKSFESYEKSIKYNPQNMGILNNYSYFLALAKKDLDKAEKMSSLTIQAEPQNPTYLDTYGWVLFKQGAYSFARMYIEKSIQYTKEEGEEVSAEVWEHYGDILYKLNDKEKAVENWEKAKDSSQADDNTHTLDKKIETGTYIEKDATL